MDTKEKALDTLLDKTKLFTTLSSGLAPVNLSLLRIFDIGNLYIVSSSLAFLASALAGVIIYGATIHQLNNNSNYTSILDERPVKWSSRGQWLLFSSGLILMIAALYKM